MKPAGRILFLTGIVALIFASCKKNNNNNDDDNQPVTYTVTYTFEFPKGGYENMVLKYMDKEQQIQTVNNPEFPWSITLQDFESGDSLKLRVNFTAQPGPEIEYSGLAKFQQGTSSIGENNCGQKIMGLQQAIPLSCNAETKIP